MPDFFTTTQSSKTYHQQECGTHFCDTSTLALDVAIILHAKRPSDFVGLQVSSSVIGRNCHIGKGVQIQGCYIHNNVSIGDGAQLQSALICDGASIMSQATLHTGCIVSYKVKRAIDLNLCVAYLPITLQAVLLHEAHWLWSSAPIACTWLRLLILPLHVFT